MSKLKPVEMRPDDERRVKGLQAELLALLASMAARNMPRAAAEKLGAAVDAGEKDLHLNCIWGVDGMRLQVSAIDKDGFGVVILKLSTPPPDDDEAAEPPPAVH